MPTDAKEWWLQVAVEPKALVVYSRMNGDCKLIVQDSSSLCSEGEEVSYATLQLRAQAVDQVRLHLQFVLESIGGPCRGLGLPCNWLLSGPRQQ